MKVTKSKTIYCLPVTTKQHEQYHSRNLLIEFNKDEMIEGYILQVQTIELWQPLEKILLNYSKQKIPGFKGTILKFDISFRLIEERQIDNVLLRLTHFIIKDHTTGSIVSTSSRVLKSTKGCLDFYMRVLENEKVVHEEYFFTNCNGNINCKKTMEMQKKLKQVNGFLCIDRE